MPQDESRVRQSVSCAQVDRPGGEGVVRAQGLGHQLPLPEPLWLDAVWQGWETDLGLQCTQD